MIISIYKKSNGQITKIVNCMEMDINKQYDPLICNYLEGSFHDSKYYIENNVAVLIPPSPNKYCVFNFDTKQWYDPRTNSTQWVVIQYQRDGLLANSDWTQLPDVTLSNKTEWATYRQELRDITKQTDPFNIIWPTPPQG
jgi:hypothetical protein